MSKKEYPKSTRPIEKRITSFDLSVTSSQSNLTVRTTNRSETFNGGVISGSFNSVNRVANGFSFALLVIVREGDSANSILQANGSPTYLPEENVLWGRAWRWVHPTSGDPLENILSFTDPIKTKRKLKTGDTLHLLTSDSQVTNAGRVSGMISQFYKQ